MDIVFRFANLPYLLLLLIVPVLAALYILSQQRARSGSLQYSSVGLVKGLPGSLRLQMRHILILFRLAAIALIILGLARPQAGQAREVYTGEGVDIVLVLDMSGSMAAEDFQPQNRLGVAKEVAQDFVRDREYDRVGLVVFARNSFTQAPLTLDYNVLDRLIDQVELAPQLGLEDGTAIGIAMANAVNRLKASDAESKVIILLTDGLNNAGQIDPSTAADLAAALDIRVYTVGVGSEGPVPFPAQGFFGPTYEYVEIPLDEATLQEVAEKTDGQYFRATDAETLRRIYDHISDLEKTEVEMTRYTRYRELGGVFFIPALGLILLDILLANTLFRRIP
jgi:Ca-activated chloride channel family protein